MPTSSVMLLSSGKLFSVPKHETTWSLSGVQSGPILHNMNVQGFVGYDNEIADTFSKAFYFDDWLVEDNFQLCNRKWSHSLWFRFICRLLLQIILKFYSRFWKSNKGVGCRFDWSVGYNWFVTSVYLIVGIIKHLLLCKAKCKYSYCSEVTDCNIWSY